MCHGPEMKGTFVGPAMRGTYFMRRWGNRPLGDLFGFIHKSMPMQAPGSLDGKTVDDILAYWAKLNGYATSGAELDHESEETAAMRIQPRE